MLVSIKKLELVHDSLVSVLCDWVDYHVMCLGHYISKSEHWAPYDHIQTLSYDWKIAESELNKF